MTTFKGFASLVLAATIATTLPAEPRCPGNVESVPLHYVNGYQMIVTVSVNHSGPYDFLLDTGTQFTMIDPKLAAELHLANQDSIPVDGTGFRTAAFSVELDQLAIDSHAGAHISKPSSTTFRTSNPSTSTCVACSAKISSSISIC